jgi:hypothetical protein
MVTPSGSKWHHWSQKYLKTVKTWTRTSMKLTGTSAWRCRDSPLDFQNRGLRGSPKLDTTGEISRFYIFNHPKRKPKKLNQMLAIVVGWGQKWTAVNTARTFYTFGILCFELGKW